MFFFNGLHYRWMVHYRWFIHGILALSRTLARSSKRIWHLDHGLNMSMGKPPFVIGWFSPSRCYRLRSWTSWLHIYIYILISPFVKNQRPLTTSVVPMYICATSRFNKALSLLYANRQKARTATAATDWQQAALWFHMVAEQWSWKHPGELQQAEGLIPEHWGTLNNSWSNKG